MKLNVDERFGDEFWVKNKPTEIIDITNDMCHKHDEIVEKFPIKKDTLIDLTYVLFRWMYKAKWTDHKLIKRIPPKAN